MSSPVVLDPVATLRRTWWIPLVVVLVALVAAAVLTSRQDPTYRAEASLVVSPNTGVIDDVRDEIDALDTLDRRSVVATLARLAKSREVVAAAAERAGLDATGVRVRSVVPPNTNIIEIRVDGGDPAQVAALANATAQVAADEATKLYRAFRMRVLESASEPEWPISPSLRRNLVAAAAIGLVAGLFLAILVDALRRWRAGNAGASTP